MVSELGIGVAFIAGVVSFLSPCVLPIIPGFLAYLAGSSLGQATAKRKEIFLNSVFFVLGFSVVFAVLGVLLNTVFDQLGASYDVQLWLSRIGGVLIIFFGLFLTGLIKISFLEREHKFKVFTRFHSRYFTSFVFGAAFAAGWTPCVGPALGSILGLAATAPSSALYLLFAYAIGLGLPFMVVGFFAAQASQFINRYANVLKYVSIVFGVILIILGVLVFTQSLNLLANFDFINDLILK